MFCEWNIHWNIPENKQANSNMIKHCMFFWNPSKFPSCQFQAFLAQSMSDQSRSLTDLESSWVGFIRSFLNSSSVKNMQICGIWHIFLNHNHGEKVKAWRKNLKKKVLSDTLEPPHSPASVLFFFLSPLFPFLHTLTLPWQHHGIVAICCFQWTSRSLQHLCRLPLLLC